MGERALIGKILSKPRKILLRFTLGTLLLPGSDRGGVGKKSDNTV